MQALGFIETKGLLCAIEAADVMLKAANVSLLQKSYASGGLVCITVTGDVGAVKAAVDAGQEAVKRINAATCISAHIIPRPMPEVAALLGERIEEVEETPEVEEMPKSAETPIEAHDASPVEALTENIDEEVVTESTEVSVKEPSLESLSKTHIDAFVVAHSYEALAKELEKLTVVKLRTLARQYTGLRIAGRRISKADKKMLLEEFKHFYNK